MLDVDLREDLLPRHREVLRALRWGFLHAPGRLVHTARQLVVRILDGWPSADALIGALLAATLPAHGAAGLVGDGSATLHGDEFSGMTTVGPKAGRGVIVW